MATKKLAQLEAGGLRWIVRDGAQTQIARVCEAVEAFLSDSSVHLKDSLDVTVARAVAANGRGLIIRRLNYGRLRTRLRDVFRQSRARRAFYSGLLLAGSGVPTPEMLAVTDVRRLRWPVAGYVICDEVPGAKTLHVWLCTGCEHSRRVISRLADAIARMHSGGFIHRDLKSNNILFDTTLNPWIIDMDGVRFVRRVSLNQAAADLAVLAKTFQTYHDGLLRYGARFLRQYCKTRGLETAFRILADGILSKMRSL
jgi:tRNA A-37 threonylcarbamoyl transferase component Bud32